MAEYVQLESGIVISAAEFAEATKANPDLREIATTQNGRDITRGYVDGLPLLQPTDSVLQARGGGDYQIYDEVLRDEQVASTLQQRRLAVVSREWEVLPGGKTRRDKQAADHLKEILKHISWDAITDKMLYGIFYGHAISECLWARDGRHITIDKIKVRDRRRFGFAPDGALKLLTFESPNGEELPDRKFWHFTTGATHDDEPYGIGLAHWLYWPVLFKRNNIKFWLIFLEKFGMPTGLGKFPVGATPAERTKLLAAVHAIQADSGIIIPQGMEMELLEAARSGTADYTALFDRMNAAISKVVVGQTMTTDSGSSRSQAEVHLDVRQDLIKADSDLVCHSFNCTVARWLTDWNYPGAAHPQVWRRIEDEPDLKPQAERDKVVYDMGFKPTLEYVKSTYGEGWEERKITEPPNPKLNQPEGGDDKSAAFAEGDNGDVVAGYVKQLQAETAPAIDQIIKQVEQLVKEVNSLDELPDRLFDLYGHLDPDELTNVMQLAMSAAELAGGHEA